MCPYTSQPDSRPAPTGYPATTTSEKGLKDTYIAHATKTKQQNRLPVKFTRLGLISTLLVIISEHSILSVD